MQHLVQLNSKTRTAYCEINGEVVCVHANPEELVKALEVALVDARRIAEIARG